MKNCESQFYFAVGISNLLKIFKNMKMLNTYKIKVQSYVGCNNRSCNVWERHIRDRQT